MSVSALRIPKRTTKKSQSPVDKASKCQLMISGPMIGRLSATTPPHLPLTAHMPFTMWFTVNPTSNITFAPYTHVDLLDWIPPSLRLPLRRL